MKKIANVCKVGMTVFIMLLCLQIPLSSYGCENDSLICIKQAEAKALMLAIEECDIIKLDLQLTQSKLSDKEDQLLIVQNLMESYKKMAHLKGTSLDRCVEDNYELQEDVSKAKTWNKIFGSSTGILLIALLILL